MVIISLLSLPDKTNLLRARQMKNEMKIYQLCGIQYLLNENFLSDISNSIIVEIVKVTPF